MTRFVRVYMHCPPMTMALIPFMMMPASASQHKQMMHAPQNHLLRNRSYQWSSVYAALCTICTRSVRKTGYGGGDLVSMYHFLKDKI